MQSKKGQITVFMVVGIVLLIAIFLFFSISSMIEKNKLQAEIEGAGLPNDIRPIKNYIEKCIYEVSVPGIYLLGSQGGYVNPPFGETFETDYANMAYGYFNEEERLPTVVDMEEQISGYMADNIMPCIAGVEFFSDMGYDIEYETPVVSTIISKDDVIIKLEMPTKIKLRDVTWSQAEYVKRIPIRLGHIRDVAREIMQNHKENPALIDMEFLGSFDLFAGFAPYDDITTVYTLYDEESAIDGKFFPFFFVIRDSGINSAPVLEPIADMVMAKGVPVVVYVNAFDEQDDRLTFSSDSRFLPIGPDTGIINFTPTVKGTFFANIKVEDTSGLSDEQQVRVVVEDKMSGSAYDPPVLNSSMDDALDAYFSMTTDELLLYQYILNKSDKTQEMRSFLDASLMDEMFNMTDDEYMAMLNESAGERFIDEENLNSLPPDFFSEGSEEELPDDYFYTVDEGFYNDIDFDDYLQWIDQQHETAGQEYDAYEVSD